MGVLSPNATPPIVHRRVLAAAMWLRTGLGAQDLEVPKRMLLASCEHVLAIRPGVVDAVKRLTDALGDEEKARQLDLLVSQDRSAQMLMDKTLGAPSVVTEENLSQLFSEMLHPHLEEERRKAKDAINSEREKGLIKIDEINRRLHEIQKAEKSATIELERQAEEDRGMVEALCLEVGRDLSVIAKRRKYIGIAISILLVSPPLLMPAPWQAWISVFFGFPLAYLTLTGSKLVGTVISDKKAIAMLNKVAEARRLSAKVDRFDIAWNEERFLVGVRGAPPGEHLFSLADSADE